MKLAVGALHSNSWLWETLPHYFNTANTPLHHASWRS